MAYTTTNMKVSAIDAITIDSVDVGGTTQPYTLSVEVTKDDFYIEQSLFKILTQVTAREAQSEFELAEATLANLAIVWDLPATNLVSDVLTLDDSIRGEVTFTAATKSGGAPGTGKTRTFSFPQSFASGSPSVNYSKSEMTVVPVTFTHAANSSGSIGTITDA